MLKCNVGNRLPNLHNFRLVFKAPFHQQVQAAMLPHELFSAIYHSYSGAWRNSILPESKRVAEFWEAVKDHPQMESHPLLSRAGHKQFAIPIGFHGDGVPIVGLGKGWVKMALVFSWCSLLSFGNTLVSQFYIWSVFEKLCQSDACDGTLDGFFKILTWSFKWLWLGKWPTEDHQGKRHCFESNLSKQIDYM